MHELAATQNVLDIALRHAHKAGAKRIVNINLLVGQYAAVTDDSVRFYWDMIAEGTAAQGAQLIFTRVPAEMKCAECGHVFEPDDTTVRCPRCQSEHLHLSKGEELRVVSMDVE